MGGHVGGLVRWQTVKRGRYLGIMGILPQCGCFDMHKIPKATIIVYIIPLKGGRGSEGPDCVEGLVRAKFEGELW